MALVVFMASVVVMTLVGSDGPPSCDGLGGSCRREELYVYTDLMLVLLTLLMLITLLRRLLYVGALIEFHSFTSVPYL